ncbi:DUF914-domain-containing protein [Coniophora puteana RWD-64-598 SS2]|uniref:DUF914-domain-containing protein n=1 Tax=Coniophora puteana (strain RWD-64-598) TaxID=741705 RepID=A0A5M3MWU0_CONPW|nr:DUF914-domain-containing protein [Coniophora puteana RWD-64-598 SS2]EIW83608.1 DUF914-domain-containing protein [Coniophora puteana RWD-64-598 SS2]
MSRLDISSIHPATNEKAQDGASTSAAPSPDGADARSPGPKNVRPPIDYTSPRTFARSAYARFASIWTRQFVLSLLAGQLVSFCITVANVTTTELVNRGWALSTTQTLFMYFSLFVTYTPYTIYQYGFRGWTRMIWKDGWKYFFLAACDVEGNFLGVKAYDYTNLLSCELLDAWAIPVCLFFCWVYMRTKFHWTHLLGVLICIGGLGMLVASDLLTDKNYSAPNRGEGDAFMIVAATLYGFTNATEEFFVRRRPLYEVVGQIGMWGMLINGCQAAGLEHAHMRTATWDGATIGILVSYTVAMFILYTVAPMVYRMASSAFYNISLLTSDFYGLIFGKRYHPFWLYFPAFCVVILGLVIYFWHATPEEQGKLDPQRPEYIMQARRHERDDA